MNIVQHNFVVLQHHFKFINIKKFKNMKTKLHLPLMATVFLAGALFFAGVCPSSGYAQKTHRFRCCLKKNVQDTAAQTDTTYWQLVHPKTAKSGAIFRKGDMYVLDTNEGKFFTISDTTLVLVRSEASYKYGSTWGKIQFAELPEGRNLLSFLSELESEDDVEAISFRLKKELVKDKSPKFPYRLFRMGNAYIGGEYSSPVESDSVYVYYRNKSERELVKVPQGMSLEKFLDVLEKSRNVDSMRYYGIMRIINDDLPLSMILSEIPMSTQWGLERIYIQDAWDITMGDSNRTVAVLEPDGVDWSHYELGKGYDSYQNICVNPGEDAWDTLHVSGKVTYNPLSGNGTDDDGNGLTDDFIGWNFREGNRDCRTDSCAHGTGVAGIIAAKGEVYDRRY